MESFDLIHLQSAHTHPTSQFLLLFFIYSYAIRYSTIGWFFLNSKPSSLTSLSSLSSFSLFLLFFATFFCLFFFFGFYVFIFICHFFLFHILLYCICCAISFRVYNNFYSLLWDVKLTRANFYNNAYFGQCMPLFVSLLRLHFDIKLFDIPLKEHHQHK